MYVNIAVRNLGAARAEVVQRMLGGAGGGIMHKTDAGGGILLIFSPIDGDFALKLIITEGFMSNLLEHLSELRNLIWADAGGGAEEADGVGEGLTHLRLGSIKPIQKPYKIIQYTQIIHKKYKICTLQRARH